MLLPKNMRQMGEKEDRIKIYMEDYVLSYFQKLQLSSESWRVGVLLGMHQEREGVPCLFISGALETRAADFANGRLRFTDSTWKDIFRRREEFFPGTGVCGWFVYEKSGGMVDKLSLKKTYEEAFAQGDKVLLLHDDDDQEAFYMLWKGGLDRMRGYYIYYERNEPMQAYMEAERKLEPPREEGREAVVQQFRARMEEMRRGSGADRRDKRRPWIVRESPKQAGARILTGLFPARKEEGEEMAGVGRKQGGMEEKRAPERITAPKRTTAPENGTAPEREKAASEGTRGFLSESGWKQVRLAAACVAVLLVGVTFFNYREKLLGLESAVSDLLSLENSTAAAGATVEETGESLVAGSVAASSGELVGTEAAPDGEATLEVTLPPEGSAAAEASGAAAENVASTEAAPAETAAPETMATTEAAAPTETAASAETAAPEETRPPEETVAAVDPQSVPVDSRYLVTSGETLSQICWRLYGTLEPMERFCELNGITDPNRILTGQWLVLPE